MLVMRQQRGGVDAPRTRAELEAMSARRGELQGQLRASEGRRFELSQQAEATRPDARAGLTQRMATLDTRIVQLERQIQQLDDAIATGLANPEIARPGADVAIGTAGPPIPAIPPIPPFPIDGWAMVPPREGLFIPVNGRTLLAGGLVSLSLLALVGWLAFRYALARMSRLAGITAGSASQTNQLQQSVDAIAVEVERISENQRYVTKLLGQVPVEDLNPAKHREAQPAPVSRAREP